MRDLLVGFVAGVVLVATLVTGTPTTANTYPPGSFNPAVRIDSARVICTYC